MTHPLISVIVPVYNVQAYVGACIASLRAQVLTDFEAIIIDDGSDDDSFSMAQAAVAQDPRFRLIRQDNQGLSGARNSGLDAARGRFIAFVDSDDQVDPLYLKTLHAALEHHDADWVACAISFVEPTGRRSHHSGIHTSPDLAAHRVNRFYPLNDWPAVIRHFPSAWNKLYRQSLIEGLRFDTGTWFEDHSFFQQVALRTDWLLHVPQPLYIQTRGRPGQITSTDDDRVFEQLSVLDRLNEVMQTPLTDGGKPEAQAGFSQIASRLIFERGSALRNPKRRQAFMHAVVRWLADNRLSYTPDWDSSIAASIALELQGEIPLSVVIPWSGLEPAQLIASLASLANQHSPGREVLVVCDTHDALQDAKAITKTHPEARVLIQSKSGVGAARNHGLDVARGRYVHFLDAGDIMRAGALHDWVETMLRHDADFGISKFNMGRGSHVVSEADPDPEQHLHAGFHDINVIPPHKLRTGPLSLLPQQALSVQSHPSAKIFRRDFLVHSQLRFQVGGKSGGARSEWALVLGAGLLAHQTVYIDWPGVDICEAPAARALWHTKMRPSKLIAGHRALLKTLPAAAMQHLPSGAAHLLFARAFWETLKFGATARFSRPLLTLCAAVFVRLHPATHAQVTQQYDPFIGPRLQWVLKANTKQATLALLGRGPDNFTENKKSRVSMLSCHFYDKMRFRYRANFSLTDFANISFYDSDKDNVLFHLSLRAKDGIAVCNRRDGTVWGRERAKVFQPVDGHTRVDLHYEKGRMRVLIDGIAMFDFGPKLFRASPFPKIAGIAWVDFQGGISPVSFWSDDDIALPESGAPVLNRRIELRAAIPASFEAQSISLDSGTELVLPVIETRLGTQGPHLVRAVLPGRIWQNTPQEQAITLTLSTKDGVTLPPLSLTRRDLVKHVEGVLKQDDVKTDAFCAMQVVEHVRFAQIYNALNPAAITAFDEIIKFYDLSAYVETATAESTLKAGTQPILESAMLGWQPHMHAAAGFAKCMRDCSDNDPLMALTQALDNLGNDANARSMLVLTVTDIFCRPGHDVGAFHSAVAADIAPLLDNPPKDRWGQSMLLPHFLLSGDSDAALKILRDLAKPGPEWVITETVAWVATHLCHTTDLTHPERNQLLYAFMSFVDQRAIPYFGRSNCQALINSSADLVINRAEFAFFTRNDIINFALRNYGLSHLFWTKFTEIDAALLTPVLQGAKDAFEALDSRFKTKKSTSKATLTAALDLFDNLKTLDAPRIRREILGTDLDSVHPFAPVPVETALRHYAAPGAGLVPAQMQSPIADYITGQQSAPRARYEGLQIQLCQTLCNLLDQTLIDEAQLYRVLQDLTRLSDESSDYIGLGMMLWLLDGMLQQNSEHPLAAQIVDHVTRICIREHTRRTALEAEQIPLEAEQIPLAPLAIPAITPYTAPAVRAGLSALQAHGSTHVAKLISLFDSSTSMRAQTSIAPTSTFQANPIFDTIVTVFSCKANLETRIPAMRAGWLGRLKDYGIPYVIIVGDGDGKLEGDVLALDAPDDYEGLPQKTLATIRWVHENTSQAHMFKIDDDCFVNTETFFKSLSYRKFDYYGRELTRVRGQMDRTWHLAKSTSARGQLELDKSPEPSLYADGGSGYTLSRFALEAALEAATWPEGQLLVQSAFMEDKLLGDLLALYGIPLADEDHRVTIRRRSMHGGIAVARWWNDFDPSSVAPAKVLHLDNHEDQADALARMNKPVLHPSKIWPTFQDAALGEQSNALELISSPASVERAQSAEVAVVACMRNEMFMLPHFLAHYRKLGVTAFLIADNVSDDGTLEYLAQQPDVALFSVDTAYSLSEYGVAWQQAMIATYRQNKWTVVADADELLVWEVNGTQTLPELLATPDVKNANALRLFMLDMYPKGPLIKATFDTGNPFAEAGFVDETPFLTETLAQGPFSNMPMWTSGLRHRLIPGSRAELFVAQKIALLRYQPWMQFSAGLHFVSNVTLAKRELFFAHFKYNADFRRKAQNEVKRGQHFNDAEEYQKYLAITSEGRDVIFEEGLSVPWYESPFVRDRLG